MIVAYETIAAAVYACHEHVPKSWLALLRSHVLHQQHSRQSGQPPRVLVPDARSFRARVGSGRLGPLRFSHLEMTPHMFVADEALLAPTDGQMVLLQLAGFSTATDGRDSARLRPGAILRIGDATTWRIEHESHVEQIVLLLPPASQDASWPAPRALTLCDTNAGMERMVFRWVVDACLNADLDGGEALNDAGRALTRLVSQILRGRSDPEPAAPSPGMTSERIKDFIVQHLGDPSLTAASIAEAFGCSVRTLHRVVQRSGGESLSSHLWRMRIEACAAALRSRDAAAQSLTDLAMTWGFASSTHFSSLFRKIHGISPSEYRRAHHEPCERQH